MDSLSIIVGLGNPGKKYRLTRHNVGFSVIDRFSERCDIPCNKKKFEAVIGEGRIGESKVLLAKPQTYMNLSGVSVGKLIAYYGCPQNKLMVICDDLNLPVGAVRVRRKGSSGGHNGLKSIAQHIGSGFPRLRVGIGRPTIMDAKGYVLTPFTEDEKEDINRAIEKACQALDVWITTGIEDCMNVFN